MKEPEQDSANSSVSPPIVEIYFYLSALEFVLVFLYEIYIKQKAHWWDHPSTGGMLILDSLFLSAILCGFLGYYIHIHPQKADFLSNYVKNKNPYQFVLTLLVLVLILIIMIISKHPELAFLAFILVMQTICALILLRMKSFPGSSTGINLNIRNIFREGKLFSLRNYKSIAVFFLLIIFYFSYNAIYVNLFLHIGKPDHVGSIQGVIQDAKYSVDNFRETHHDGQQTYQLIGWAFPKELNQPLANYQKQIILINDQSLGYYFIPEEMNRKDVTKFYTALGVNLDQSGYSVYISKYVLPRGRYNIAFLFFLSDGSEPIVFRTKFYINRTANNLEIFREK